MVTLITLVFEEKIEYVTKVDVLTGGLSADKNSNAITCYYTHFLV